MYRNQNFHRALHYVASVLQCVAVCCIMLQVCCSVLQCVAFLLPHILSKKTEMCRNRKISMCCCRRAAGVLPCAAVYCMCVACVLQVLQYTVVCAVGYCSVLQRIAVHCSMQQCVAVCCSALQCAAVHYSMSQRAAVYCSAL